MHDYTIAKALKILSERKLLHFEVNAGDIECELQIVLSSMNLNRQQALVEINSGSRSARFPLGPYEQYFEELFVANGGE